MECEKTKYKAEFEKALWKTDFEISVINFQTAEFISSINTSNGLVLGLRAEDGVILKASSDWKTKIGLDTEEMKGKVFIEFVAQESRKETWSVFTSIIGGGKIHGDYKFSNFYLNGKGEKVRLEWITRLIDNGNGLFVIGLARVVKG